MEAQGQVEAISRHVQEVEGLLAELTQHQRKLTSERTEVYMVYTFHGWCNIWKGEGRYDFCFAVGIFVHNLPVA